MMPPNRPPPSAPASASAAVSVSKAAPIQPGHHRDKLDQIRDSLRPFEQPSAYVVCSSSSSSNGPSASGHVSLSDYHNYHSGNSVPVSSGSAGHPMAFGASPLTSGMASLSVNALPSTSFPAGMSYGSNVVPLDVSQESLMINTLTQMGFDKESAYYALKLVSFSSVREAAEILTRIKNDIALGHNFNYPSSVMMNSHVALNGAAPPLTTTTTTFFTSASRQPATTAVKLPRYTSVAPGPSKQQQGVNGTSSYVLTGTEDVSEAVNGPAALRHSPMGNWTRATKDKDLHRSHAKISLKQSTSFDPHSFVRVPCRSPVSAVTSAPPASTVITIEQDSLPQQQRPPRRDTVSVIRTRVERPSPKGTEPPRYNKTSTAAAPAAQSIQSIIVDPEAALPVVPNTSYVTSYVDQFCVKSAARAPRERDSVLSSEHPSGGNVSPARSSGFTSPAAGVPEAEGVSSKRRSTSPLPASVARKLKSRTYERFVKPMKPGMYQFFVEQHFESLIRQYNLRKERALQLQREMQAAELTTEMQDTLLRLLTKRESNYIRLKRQKMNKNMFDVLQHIGVGAFGKVALVKKKDNKQIYAMKILSKTDVIHKKQSAHVKAERDILAEANSDWIVRLFFSFQDSHNLYFIMEYVPGGDMMQLLIVKGVFKERLARFYIAELTMAINDVHRLGFIHRDIKPDNILIDRKGHIKLTDFGLCTGLRWTHDKRRYNVYEEDGSGVRHSRDDSFSLPPECRDKSLLDRGANPLRTKAHSVVGTTNYMAPEVILRSGHTQQCDWWSVGVILYEMVFGRPPFLSHNENQSETSYRIINWRSYLDLRCPLPPEQDPLSEECIDVIRRLCCDQEHRMGAKEIREHRWFKGLDFDKLRSLPAEFVPKVKHAEDTSNFDVSDLNAQDLFKNETLKSGKNFNPAFYDFTFRHFFDFEDGQPCPTNRTQQRPSLDRSVFEVANAHTNGTRAEAGNATRRPTNGKSTTKQATVPQTSEKTRLAAAAPAMPAGAPPGSGTPRKDSLVPDKPFTRILQQAGVSNRNGHFVRNPVQKRGALPENFRRNLYKVVEPVPVAPAPNAPPPHTSRSQGTTSEHHKL